MQKNSEYLSDLSLVQFIMSTVALTKTKIPFEVKSIMANSY